MKASAFRGEGTALERIVAERAEIERRRKISEYRSAPVEMVDNLPPSKPVPKTRDIVARNIGNIFLK